MKSIYFGGRNSRTQNSLISISALVLLLAITRCEEFVKVDPPRTDLVKSTVFSNDETAKAAVLDIYYQLRTSGFANGSEMSISFLASLCSDEEIDYYNTYPEGTAAVRQFYDNALAPNNTFVLNMWTDLYKCIFKANSVLEGLSTSTGVSTDVKKQLEGQAKFIRAFCHFYLVNLWGDAPIVLSTDYHANSSVPRSPEGEVYKQIINDLTDAQKLLLEDYSFSNGERVCANKGAATAMLARAYLYTGDWANAETQASAVLSNDQYSLGDELTGIFLANSNESMLQVWHDYIPNDRLIFTVFSTGPNYGALRPDYANDFEAGDQRWTAWGRSRVVDGVTYYYPLKYFSNDFTPPAQYSTVLRLAEQYLIRAEARVQQNNIAGAQSDLNRIRNRAGLGDTPASDKASLLQATLKERKSELFTEWGHRWFDLKRMKVADAVLSPIKPQWTSAKALFPIPEYELKNNLKLRDAQNPGY